MNKHVKEFYAAADERKRLARIETALREIELRTRAYADAADWPLVSGVHAVARAALKTA